MSRNSASHADENETLPARDVFSPHFARQTAALALLQMAHLHEKGKPANGRDGKKPPLDILWTSFLPHQMAYPHEKGKSANGRDGKKPPLDILLPA
jgi:hypothetical protein